MNSEEFGKISFINLNKEIDKDIKFSFSKELHNLLIKLINLDIKTEFFIDTEFFK